MNMKIAFDNINSEYIKHNWSEILLSSLTFFLAFLYFKELGLKGIIWLVGLGLCLLISAIYIVTAIYNRKKLTIITKYVLNLAIASIYYSVVYGLISGIINKDIPLFWDYLILSVILVLYFALNFLYSKIKKQ